MANNSLQENLRLNLAYYMNKSGLNAVEFARRADLNRTAIHDILKGKSNAPRLDTVEKLSVVLGVSALQLLAPHVSEEGAELRRELIQEVDRLDLEQQARLIGIITFAFP